jgi:S1-C subfamily serine protease
VAPESPAAQADIRDGDVLIAINGMTPDAYAATVKGQVWEQPAGTAVQLSLRRGSAAIDRRVELQDFLTARQ